MAEPPGYTYKVKVRVDVEKMRAAPRAKMMLKPMSLISFLLCFSLLLQGATGSSCAGSQYYCALTGTTERDCGKCGKYSVPDIDADPKICIERQVFSETYWLHDAFGVLIWFVGAGFAMAAGVGGGGIFVPIGIILLRFSAKTVKGRINATGLSQASIFGASLSGLLINLKNRHPIADRPLIDLDMALFLAPMEMSGAVAGVLIQKVLPDWAVILIMAVILGYTAYKTFDKGFKQRAKDLKAREVGDATAKDAGAIVEAGGNEKPATAPEDDGAAASRLSPSPSPESDASGTGGAAAKPAKDQQSGGTTNATSTDDAGASTPPAAAPENVDVTLQEEHNLNAQSLPIGSQQGSAAPTDGSGPARLEIQVPAETEKDTSMDAAASRLAQIQRDSPKFLRSQSRLKSRDEWLSSDAGVPTKQYGYLAGLWVFLLLLLLLRGGKGVDSLLGIGMCGVGYWLCTLAAFVFLFLFGSVMARRAVHKSVRKQAVDFPFVEGDVVWTLGRAGFYALWTFVAGVIAGLIGIGGGMVLGPLMIQMGILPQVSSATTATLVALTSSSAALMFITSGLVPWSYALLFFCVAFCGAYVGKSKIDKVVKEKKMTSILIFILASIIAFATVMISVAGLLKYEDQDWCFEGMHSICHK